MKTSDNPKQRHLSGGETMNSGQGGMLPEQPVRPNMVQLLLRTRERMMQRFKPILARFSLTEQQWRVIRALAQVEGMEPNELSREASILGPSLVGVIRRMMRSDLVTKKRHPGDQRRAIISLTARGRDVYRRAWPLMDAEYVAIARQTGEQEMTMLLDQLQRFHDSLTDRTAGSDKSDSD